MYGREYLVYAAGPITGATYDGACDWRDDLATLLADTPIRVLSPMRAKAYLRSPDPLSDAYALPEHPLSTARGIMTRDHNDVQRSDLVIANLLGAERVSIGTCMECAWCFSYRVPLILVMDEHNVHNHAMIREAAGFVVPTLEAAADLAQAILLPGAGSVEVAA